MINANNTNTPASNRKKYMDVFGGTNKKTNTPTEIKKTAAIPTPNTPKRVIDKPKNNPANSIKKTKKIFGLDAKSVVAVASIALFFVFSMAGVLISLQQRMNPDQVAVPTAPKSKPAAAEIVEPPSNTSCSLSFNITESSPSPSPSPSVTPSPSVSPSPTPSVSPTPSPSVTPSPSPSVSPSPSPSVSPSPSPYICDSTCTTNEQCETASSDYICYQNNCRLDSNPSAENCQPDTPPSIGCNDSCINNADCLNSEQICYNNACRLATNPTSSTCSIAQTYQPTKGQPALPAELPQSGSNALLDWFKAGLGVMGIGAVLLLLL